MIKINIKAIILIAGLLLSGVVCADVLSDEQQQAQGEPSSQNKPEEASSVLALSKHIMLNALTYVGVQYKWGGESAITGFDCSGFVRAVFLKAVGITLPRTAMEMSRIGTPVQLDDLLPGDLVFFKTARGNFAQVGIYIGMDRFVHAPQTGSSIQIENLDNKNYLKRFTGGRRVSN